MGQRFSGGCYCGNISIDFQTSVDPATLNPRAYNCAFSKHNGAVWISDPAGKIDIAVMNEAALSLFERGNRHTRYWICQRCGTTTAATCEINGQLHGAVNINCIDNGEIFGQPTQVPSLKLEADEEVCRWSELWTKNVVVKEAWDVGL